MVVAIERMNPDVLPDAGKVGYSQISIPAPGRLAFVSGQVAWRAGGGTVPDTLSGQTAVTIDNLRSALSVLGCRPEDIVQMRIYLTDLQPETQDIVMSQIKEFLNGSQPSLTGVGVSALATPELQIEIEMVVRVPE